MNAGDKQMKIEKWKMENLFKSVVFGESSELLIPQNTLLTK
jgi:hypothetical protein